jgi:regulatory protein
MAEARCLRQNGPPFGPDSFSGFSPEESHLMPAKAYEYSLELLAARAYTTRNLRRKLVQKGFAPEEISATVDRLTGAGLLDDLRFATEFARQKLTIGGESVRRVGQRLTSRGIKPADVKAAIQSVLDDEPIDIQRSIEASARKKLASMGGLEPEVRRRRLFAFLARRGFELDDIRRAVERAQSSDSGQNHK